jgi:hypothetical protein
MEFIKHDRSTDLNLVTKNLKDLLGIKLSRVRERHATAMGFNSYNHLISAINEKREIKLPVETYLDTLNTDLAQHHHLKLTPELIAKITNALSPQEREAYNYLLIRIDLLTTTLNHYHYHMSNSISGTDNKQLFNAVKTMLPSDVTLKGGLLIDMPLSIGYTGFQGAKQQFEAAVLNNVLDNNTTTQQNKFFETENNTWRLDVDTKSLMCLCQIEPRKEALIETYIASPELLTHLQLTFNPEFEEELEERGETDFIFAARVKTQALTDLVIRPQEEFEEDETYKIDEVTFFDEVVEQDELYLFEGMYQTDWDEVAIFPERDILKITFDSLKNYRNIESLCLVSESHNGWPVGTVYFRDEHPPTLVFKHFDDLGGLAGNLSSASNFGTGKLLKTICPDALYQVYSSEDTFCEYYDDLNNIPYSLVYGAFAEQIREWPEATLPVPTKDSFFFEIHKDKLVNELSVDKVVVDDFQELHGDMSSVIIAGFYSGNSLVAEVAYSVIVQNDKVDRENNCIEITFDEKLKAFSEPNNIPIHYSERCVFHEYGERKLSHFQSDHCLIPTKADEYLFKNLLLINVVIGYNDLVSHPLDTNKLNNLIARLFIPCVKNIDGTHKQHPLKTTTVNYTQINTTSLDEIKTTLIAKLEDNSNQEIENTVGDNIIIGGFNLEGMPEHEVSTSLRNMGVSEVQDGVMEVDDNNLKQWQEELDPNILGVKYSFIRE